MVVQCSEEATLSERLRTEADVTDLDCESELERQRAWRDLHGPYGDLITSRRRRGQFTAAFCVHRPDLVAMAQERIRQDPELLIEAKAMTDKQHAAAREQTRGRLVGTWADIALDKSYER